MKILKWCSAIFCVISVLIIILFTAVDVVAVRDRDFYKQQYYENGVYNFVDIEEKELMNVTDTLLDYMIGKDDSLYIEAEYNGKKTDFFDETEKAHMVDVRNLFIIGINIRRVLFLITAICIGILVFTKTDVKSILAKAYMFVVSIVTIFGAALAFIISKDFTSAFYLFHHILFTNDLWLLDVNTSKLVNMVPESFFIEVALRIAVLFAAGIFILFILSLFILLRSKRHRVIK